ncbi:1-aminocyclopropane-1-carboxylate deaminase [Pseudomonas fluorescens]|uniref:1-aminocyclopropane-1-carboxylate deaminase/D-cysteine desulfhydrase n=1 Tax=Pseudomonas fluorescens TaxID=294 RepID=UPI0012538DC5|nr:pyridoxal-phosphate dependent enzyme [Pseudomonas fluorescens]CAG8865420.1 1-aminocyclopropane-1-carboxylate deaminase [Pseudomonas fluorescens]VVP67100.1 1-aminocyclopropane-1-carboxylate deaminase [Pseudomonas fluorescens]
MSNAFLDLPQAPLHKMTLPWLETAGVEVSVLRLDLIDPLITGNKGFKLREHLRQARDAGAPGLISLGGNHSNHLHALAAAGKRFGFATAGLLRGVEQDTPTVRDLRAFGMQLHWLGYGGYRARHQPDFWAPWQDRYPGWHCIPEGGGGVAGMQGCALIVEQARAQLAALGWADYDAWWLAAGTGTTLAGLVRAEAGAHEVHGACAVPPGHGVEDNVRALAGEHGYRLHDASLGGFAKADARLLAFIEQSESLTGVPLEPVYTGKALLALREQVEAGAFSPGTRLIFVHTGGLQGRRGYSLPQ